MSLCGMNSNKKLKFSCWGFLYIFSLFCLFPPLLNSLLVLLPTHTSIIAVHALQVFIFCGVGKEPSVNSNTKCKIVVHYSPFYLSLLKYENFLPLCKIDNILIYYECLFVRKLLMYSNPQNTDFFSEINIFVLSLVSRQSLPL